MAGKKWPKSTPITIKLREEHITKKPENLTMTEWIRGMIEAQDRFSEDIFEVLSNAAKQ